MIIEQVRDKINRPALDSASTVCPASAYRFGSFRLDPDTRVLQRNGDVVSLPPKAIDTLLVLVKSAGQPVDKEALIRAVWPEYSIVRNIKLVDGRWINEDDRLRQNRVVVLGATVAKYLRMWSNGGVEVTLIEPNQVEGAPGPNSPASGVLVR